MCNNFNLVSTFTGATNGKNPSSTTFWCLSVFLPFIPSPLSYLWTIPKCQTRTKERVVWRTVYDCESLMFDFVHFFIYLLTGLLFIFQMMFISCVILFIMLFLRLSRNVFVRPKLAAQARISLKWLLS